jgi:hypothetical protein
VLEIEIAVLSLPIKRAPLSLVLAPSTSGRKQAASTQRYSIKLSNTKPKPKCGLLSKFTKGKKEYATHGNPKADPGLVAIRPSIIARPIVIVAIRFNNVP